MFLKTSLVTLMITGFMLVSCNTSKDFPQSYKGEQIHFGQGGGFTGEVTYFALLDDGRLFQGTVRDSTFTYMDSWNKSFVTQILASYHTLQLDKIAYYEPGDLYYFIQYRKEEAPFHRITWGKHGFIPDPKVVHFYNLLYKSTKPKS